MRELLAAMEKADIVILTRTELVSGGVLRGIINRITPFLKPDTHIFLSSFIPRSIKAVNSNVDADFDLLCRRRAVPLSAIGNPRGFELMLDKMGFSLQKPLRYPDHHQFTRRDIEYINRQVMEQGGHIILTTEKDMVRLGKLVKGFEAPVYTVPIDFKVKNESEFLGVVNEVLCSNVTVKRLFADTASVKEEDNLFSVLDDYKRIASKEESTETVPNPAKVKETPSVLSDADWWTTKKK